MRKGLRKSSRKKSLRKSSQKSVRRKVVRRKKVAKSKKKTSKRSTKRKKSTRRINQNYLKKKTKRFKKKNMVGGVFGADLINNALEAPPDGPPGSIPALAKEFVGENWPILWQQYQDTKGELEDIKMSLVDFSGGAELKEELQADQEDTEAELDTIRHTALQIGQGNQRLLALKKLNPGEGTE